LEEQIVAKSLIITEKPSVAQEFARILGVSGRNDGYIENDGYVITWCVGHLVEMVYPEEYDERYKKWRLEDLPFLPRDYKYNVIPSVSRQYDVVHKMLHREDIDTVYWAGDAGKEGQTIEENIRKFGGVREGMKELRVWIDSQTEEEILRGIREAKDMSEYDNLAKSGVMRTIEDYAMGINFSRAMSVKYGKLLNDAAGTSSYTAIAVGRVMTCVLGMVVIREREIRNFTETPFYRVVGTFHPAGEEECRITAEWKAIEGSKYFESPLLYKENGFKKEESAQTLIAELKGQEALIDSVETGTQKKRAPLLFNLAELQAECSKRFKISPDETLQVAQDLYEKKLTTYPRTDARVLSSAVAKEITKNISRLKNFAPVAPYVERIMKEGRYRNIGNTQYTDDSKITDHYAIIPTGQLTELESLNSLQRSVYEMIVRRFLSIFYPPAEYQTVKLVVAAGGEKLYTSAKQLKVPGYLEIAGVPKTAKERNAAKTDGEEQTQGSDAEAAREEEENAGLLAYAGRLQKGEVLFAGGACPAAALDVCVGDAADGRDIDRDACRRAGRVAPGERDAERFGEFPVAEHELFGPCAGRVGRERQRQQGAHRAGAHRSDVAQVYGKGFAPQFAGRSCGTQEMDAFGEHVGREDQRFALPDGEHGAIVADSFEPVVGQSGEEFFYVVYESEFGHGSRVCPAAAPRRPVRVFGFFTCGCRPGGGVPAWGRERSLCEPRQGRGRRLKSLFNGRCRTKVLKIL